MKNFMFKSSFLVILLLFSGCGYKQSSVQKDDEAFLKFNTTSDYKVVVNDIFNINVSHIEKDTSFRVKSGKNNIKAYKNGKLIFEEEVFLGRENTKIIYLP